VFEGEVDFGNELQPGDSFEILFEKIVREGEFGGYGDIVAARFTTGGRSFEAFRYAVPGQKADYYDRDGVTADMRVVFSPSGDYDASTDWVYFEIDAVYTDFSERLETTLEIRQSTEANVGIV